MCGGFKPVTIKLLKSNASNSAIVLYGLLLLAGNCSAAPIVSVDAIPAEAGIQSGVTVIPGTSFSIDIIVSGIEAGSPLQGFEFDLTFDPSVLSPIAISEGGFLVGPAPFPSLFPPNGTVVLESDLGPPDINFSVTALGLSTTFGAGTIATVDFMALNAGINALNLLDVSLTGNFGTEFANVALENGTIFVKDDDLSISEPSTLFLLAFPFVPLMWKRCSVSKQIKEGAHRISFCYGRPT